MAFKVITTLFILSISLTALAQVRGLSQEVSQISEELLDQSIISRKDNQYRLLLGLPVILTPQETEIALATDGLKQKLKEDCEEENKESSKFSVRMIAGSGAIEDKALLAGEGYEFLNVRSLNVPTLLFLYRTKHSLTHENILEKSPFELASLLHQDILNDPASYLATDGKSWGVTATPSRGAILSYLSFENALNISTDPNLTEAQKMSQITRLLNDAGKQLSFEEKLSMVASLTPRYDYDKAGFKKGHREEISSFLDIMKAEDKNDIAGICGDQHFAKAQMMSMLLGDKAKDNVFIYSYVTENQQHFVTGVINPDDPSELTTINYGKVRTLENGRHALQAAGSQDMGTQVRIFTPNNGNWEKMTQKMELLNGLGAFYNELSGVEATPLNEDAEDGQKFIEGTFTTEGGRAYSLFKGTTSTGIDIFGTMMKKESETSRGLYTKKTDNSIILAFEERPLGSDLENGLVPRILINSEKDREWKASAGTKNALIGVRRRFSGHMVYVPGENNPTGDAGLSVAPRVKGEIKITDKTKLHAETETEYVLGFREGRAITDIGNYHKNIRPVRNYTTASMGIEHRIKQGKEISGELERLNTSFGNTLIARSEYRVQTDKLQAAVRATRTLSNTNPVFIVSELWCVEGELSTRRFSFNAGLSADESQGTQFNVGTRIKLGK